MLKNLFFSIEGKDWKKMPHNGNYLVSFPFRGSGLKVEWGYLVFVFVLDIPAL